MLDPCNENLEIFMVELKCAIRHNHNKNMGGGVSLSDCAG